jgi:hypothetical protein
MLTATHHHALLKTKGEKKNLQNWKESITQSTYIKFEYVKQSTYIEFEYVKQSTYIKVKYVFRVIRFFFFK